MQRRTLYLLMALLFTNGRVTAQHFRLVHWGIEQGLSQGINHKIIRDTAGFLWISSYEGVNRFDGKTFRNFYSWSREKNAIHGIETTGLVEDRLGHIWIGSGDGLNRYDPVTDSMSHFLPDSSPVKKGRYIVPVAATNTEVICFDIHGQLTAYNINTLQRRTITKAVAWYNNYVNVNNAWLDVTNNNLWMPAQQGVARINLSSGKTQFLFNSLQVNALLFDEAAHRLLLGTNDGLLVADTTTQQSDRFPLLPVTNITCMEQAADGATWIGTEQDGLFIINANKILAHLVKQADDPQSIYSNKINSIFCGSNGIAWIGVGTNGIDQLIPENRFSHYSQAPHHLNNNIVRSFIEDPQHHIWMATQGGGINVFDPASGQFSVLNRANVPGLPFDLIRFMEKEDSSHALVGTEKGLCRINTQTRKATKLAFHRANGSPLPDPYIEQIVPFTNQSMLIATKEFGLFTLSRDSCCATQLPFPRDRHVFYTAFVDDLLFVSLWDDPPAIFRVKDGQWKPLQQDISRFLITFVWHDAKIHRYWIGTLQGLLETDEELHIIRQYTMQDGLSNHYIYALVPDADGSIWISTNKGLCQFNTNTHRFKTFTPADGLQGYEYNAKAAFRATDGTIYFGGINGFDRIDTGFAAVQPGPARFYVKDLLVNNVAWAGNRDINYTKAVDLPYSGNNITLRTGVIDQQIRGDNKIRFKLEGSDHEWRTADRDFIINYSGLQPGKYTFLATAANANDAWNPELYRLELLVAGPWWKSWWLRISLVLLLTIAVIAGIRSYYRRQLQQQQLAFEKQQAVQHERTRIATDMHDDLGAGLSRIKFLSETVDLKVQQQQPVTEDIGKIKGYAQDMIGKMGEIVWALNEKNDTLSDLLAYTRAYAMEYLSQSGIDCAVQAPDQFPVTFVSGEFRRNIFLTVKEVLHNTVKHAQATAVVMKLDLTSGLHISLADNGTGFNPAAIRQYSNGLNNMKKRIADLGGSLEIKSNNGTTVSFFVPLP